MPLGALVMDLNGLIMVSDTATCVWELPAQERTLDEVAPAVAEHFDVIPGGAASNVQPFVDEIVKIAQLEQST